MIKQRVIMPGNLQNGEPQYFHVSLDIERAEAFWLALAERLCIGASADDARVRVNNFFDQNGAAFIELPQFFAVAVDVLRKFVAEVDGIEDPVTGCVIQDFETIFADPHVVDGIWNTLTNIVSLLEEANEIGYTH